jgi:cell division protein ZapA
MIPMETPPQKTVNIRIFNQTYNIRANDGNVERTLRLAEMVDQRMFEVTNGALTSDSLKVAILAALHLADELDKANHKYDELSQAVSTRSGACVEMLDQLLA